MELSRRTVFAAYIRNFVFGVEDSLVSTVGLLSGIAAAGTVRKQIILTGVVLIFVEAFSMAVGSFLSEESAEEYLTRSDPSVRTSLLAALVMFTSYIAAGFVPLSPYLLFPINLAFPASVILSLIALIILGVIGAKISGRGILRGGIKMVVIGGIALSAGIGLGKLLGGV